MHDLKFIRTNPSQFDDFMKMRGLPAQSSAILALDEKRRALQQSADDLLAERNTLSRQVGELKKNGENADDVVAQVQSLKQKIADLEADESKIADELKSLLSTLPNMPMADVPLGEDENDNVQVRTWGTPKAFDFSPKQHFELGEDLGILDFEQAGVVSGARFAYLKGDLARLERAVGNFMTDLHVDTNGLREIQVPLLVRDNAVYGTGQLPKFADDLFHTNNGHWLIPTAEVPLTNLYADKITDESTLPDRMVAWSPCFRAEAGSAGRDTRGLIRMHQFYKVEMVTICHPDTSEDELNRMTNCAEMVLQQLNLPYRVVMLCTGDMGFGARRTYDIEVWLPGQDTYREISSCSNCGDFQARRMNARFRANGEKGTQPLHTLNGSGLATGRTLVAIMENYQNADGTITIPDVLVPYMGGKTTVSPLL